MNRRSFFTKLGLAAASLAVLPAATTYARKWVATESRMWIPNPAWETAEYQLGFMQGPLTWPMLNELSRRLSTIYPPARFKQGPNGELISAPYYIDA